MTGEQTGHWFGCSNSILYGQSNKLTKQSKNGDEFFSFSTLLIPGI